MNGSILLPCPFCGGRAETDSQQSYWSPTAGIPRDQAAVYCLGPCGAAMTTCYADVPDLPRERVMELLVENWNRRAGLRREMVAAALREHWLTGVQCNHDDKTDVATCFCARWRSADSPNVAVAVSEWINHVMEYI